jgi:hypothetical protein
MSTTSLKVPIEVKQLVAAVARQKGVTTHAFMVDAIRVMATAADKRAQFVAEAVASREETQSSGKGYDVAEVKAYLLERAQGKTIARPKAKSWRA